MGRPKGSTNTSTKPKAAAVSQLASAVDFIGCATRVTGPNEYAGFIQFVDGWALAFDGVLSAGHKIEESFTVSPQLDTLKRAIATAKGKTSYTVIDNNRLAVTADKFRAIVPCMPLADMPDVSPDAAVAPITDAVRDGFEQLGPLVKESGLTVVEASLLLQANSMVATDRVVMAEYWHGVDLPPALLLPKVFLNAIIANKKKLVGFGFTAGTSVTFHYEDGSWIKTQMFSEGWPNWQGVLNQQVSPAPIPAGIFEAVEAVLPFSKEGSIYFGADTVRSHDDIAEGASFECPNAPANWAFNGKRFLYLKGRCDTIAFSQEARAAFFFNTTPPMRGAISMRMRAQGAQIWPESEVPVPPEFHPAPIASAAPEPAPAFMQDASYVPASQAFATFDPDAPETFRPQFSVEQHNANVAADTRTVNEKMYPGISTLPNNGVRSDVPWKAE
jgi:hypothetical protein